MLESNKTVTILLEERGCWQINNNVNTFLTLKFSWGLRGRERESECEAV